MYESKVVIEEQEKLRKIKEDLTISYMSGIDDRMKKGMPSTIGISFPLKGNAELIAKLKRIGWNCAYRVKRNGTFIQKMEKDMYYQKYAIYKTSFGLRAKEYYDDMRDIRRCGLTYIKEISLPVTVNSVGGYTSFIEEYDIKEGFLEIVELPENEEPLTREQMYPKNSELFKYGWIDRAGNTYTCGFEGHSHAAAAICRELGIDSNNAERELEKQGYVKISRPAPYNPDNYGKTCPYYSMSYSEVGRYISKRQYEKLCELGLGDTWEVKLWSREEI